VGHSPADQGGGDVVEKTGKHKHHDQEQKAPFPVPGQKAGQQGWQPGFFKMPGEKGKTQEQGQEIHQGHPFLPHLSQPAGKPGAGAEIGTQAFVEGHRHQPEKAHSQGMVLKQGHPQEGETK